MLNDTLIEKRTKMVIGEVIRLLYSFSVVLKAEQLSEHSIIEVLNNEDNSLIMLYQQGDTFTVQHVLGRDNGAMIQGMTINNAISYVLSYTLESSRFLE